jgi:hypothetical protein
VEGAEVYLAYLDGIIAANRANLPGKWEAFILPETRQKLEKAISGLQ